jgi:hypothetical protein
MSRKTSAVPPDGSRGVGYKRPPEDTRFRKGQSGNPSGKRKSKPVHQENDREAVLSQRLTMTLQGRRVTVTARQALYQKLLAKALNDDLRAMAILLKLDAQNQNLKPAAPDTAEVADHEQALIARFLKRQADAMGEGGGDE